MAQRLCAQRQKRHHNDKVPCNTFHISAPSPTSALLLQDNPPLKPLLCDIFFFKCWQAILLPVCPNQPLDKSLPGIGCGRSSTPVLPWPQAFLLLLHISPLFWPPPSQSVLSPVFSDGKLLGAGSRVVQLCHMLFCSPENYDSLWTVAVCLQEIWMWIKTIYFIKHSKKNT